MDRILKIVAATIVVAAFIIIAPTLCKGAYLLLDCLFSGDDGPSTFERWFMILLAIAVVLGLLGGLATHWRTKKE